MSTTLAGTHQPVQFVELSAPPVPPVPMAPTSPLLPASISTAVLLGQIAQWQHEASSGSDPFGGCASEYRLWCSQQARALSLFAAIAFGVDRVVVLAAASQAHKAGDF
jgi:hypothetical protein